MNALRGLASFGGLLVGAFLQTATGNTVVQWICGRTNGGHSYKVGLVCAEDSPLFVLDPLSLCKHCQAPMDESRYDAMVANYVAMTQGAMDEDEAW